jgi:transposase-like protein
VTETNVFNLSQPGTFSDRLTEVLRSGARALLAQAVESEVAAFLDRHADRLTADGLQRVVRHGHLPEREIVTGIGPVPVRTPRVRDRVGRGEERIRFCSAILPPYARRSKSLEVLIPILYLKGVSSGDFEAALAALLGPDAGGLSASTVARLKDAWTDEHARWLKRDLSARRYVYFWADGIHVQARLEDQAQCLLVIIGATPEGKKELVGLIDGVRESAQSWRELLLDLKRRGLEIGPELAVADGALGFWQAIEEVWPKTRGQRCWVHKTANVLNKLPKSQQSRAKRALHEIWMAETRADAESASRAAAQPSTPSSRATPSSTTRPSPAWPRACPREGGGPRGAARLLRLPGRALEAPANQQPHREHLRDSAPSNRAIKRLPLQQDRARHDIQARPGGREELAPPQRPQPVAQAHPGGKVRRRDRSRQATASSRRLIPSVTKIRR